MIGILAIAFVAWAGVVWRASKLLSEKFDAMRADFHAYSIRVEHRITCLEAKEVRAYNLVKTLVGEPISGVAGEDALRNVD